NTRGFGIQYALSHGNYALTTCSLMGFLYDWLLGTVLLTVTTVGHLICLLVSRMPGMPLHPVHVDGVPGGFTIYFLPVIRILDRFLRRGFPAIAFPAAHPLGNALADILRVRIKLHLASALELPQTPNGRHQLHSVVGGLQLTPVHGLERIAVAQNNTPSPGARITFTGPVGIHHHLTKIG